MALIQSCDISFIYIDMKPGFEVPPWCGCIVAYEKHGKNLAFGVGIQI